MLSGHQQIRPVNDACGLQNHVLAILIITHCTRASCCFIKLSWIVIQESTVTHSESVLFQVRRFFFLYSLLTSNQFLPKLYFSTLQS